MAFGTIESRKKTVIINGVGTGLHFYFKRSNPTSTQANIYANSVIIPERVNSGSTDSVLINPTTTGCIAITIDSVDDADIYITSQINPIVKYLASETISPVEDMKRIGNMMDDDTSFCLLHANPKLTGNVKVVVDSEGNLFLDTFKVSKALSQKRYRRIPLNPDEYYGRTLMSKMKSMPATDFYKIEDSCYDILSTATDLSEQYYDTYNYGVRTNRDKLYSENFSILAPLCIKRKMPDFFLVFKIKNYESNLDSSGNETSIINNSFFIDINNTEIVKCFDMRENTDLGKYIRNIYEEQKNFVGDIFDSEDLNHPNIYNGISLDDGVVAKIYESNHDMRMVNNQVALNDYYTNGFERNHIVSKDTINLEFMFDDKSGEMFSINNYFGLYVKLNGEDSDFSCIKVQGKTNIFDTSVSGENFVPSSLPNTIYGLSSPEGFRRLQENIKHSPIIEEYELKPHKNIATVSVYENTTYQDGNHAFVSVQFNDVLDPGEHYRIINNATNTIYEVLVSNAFNYNEISEKSYDSSVYDIERIALLNTRYRKTVSDDDKKVMLSKQLKNLCSAFNQFGNGIKAFTNGTDTLSIIIEHSAEDKVYFEKILSYCAYDEGNLARIAITDKTDSYYYEDESSYIFGLSDIDRVILYPDQNSVFYPEGFENLGARLANIVEFVHINENTDKLVDINITDSASNYSSIVFRAMYPENENKPYSRLSRNIGIFMIDASLNKKRIDEYSVLGFGLNKNYILRFDEQPSIQLNDKIQIYQNYPLNAGLCSIFQIKDYEYNVIDAYNHFILTSGTDWTDNYSISETRGEYQNGDNVFNKAIATFTEESFMDYVDKYQVFKPTKHYTLSSDASLGYYINNLILNNHTKSDIPLLSPCCCKWKFVGTDHTGNRARMMYNFMGDSSTTPYLTKDASSYWIPGNDSSYIGLVSADIKDTNEINKYIKDYCSYNNYATFSDYIHEGEGTLDDLIFYRTNQECRFSKVYEYGENSIEFMSAGVKIRMESSDKASIDFTKYTGYSALLVCMDGNNPRYPGTYELFIDENNNELALFVYNGSDSKSLLIQKPDIDTVYCNVYHTTIIPETISANNKLYVRDDADFAKSIWNWETSTFIDNTYAYNMIFLSKPSDIGISTDSYVMMSGHIYGFEKIDNQAYITLTQPEILKDGSPVTPSGSGNIMNTVDAYIISSVNNINTSPLRGNTLTLDDMRNKVNSYSIFIKNSDGITEYNDGDNILQIDLVDPCLTERENNDNKITTFGYTNPTFIVPLTKNILNFNYSDDMIESASEQFNKSFNGCNIELLGTTTIDQTWMKKVVNLDNSMSLTSVDSSTYRVISDMYYIIDVSSGENLPKANVKYKDTYDRNFTLEDISYDTSTSETRYILTDNVLMISDVSAYNWSVRIDLTPQQQITNRGLMTIYGSDITPVLKGTINGYYNGYFLLQNGESSFVNQTFRMNCPTYTFYVDTKQTQTLPIENFDFNTNLIAYDSKNERIDVYGNETIGYAKYDGMENDSYGKKIQLRLPAYNSGYPYRKPAYFCDTTSRTEQPFRIYVDQYAATTISNEQNGTSNLIKFKIKSIETRHTYNNINLVFKAATPDTVMEEMGRYGYKHNTVTEITSATPHVYDCYGRTESPVYTDITDKTVTYTNSTSLTLLKNLNPLIPYCYTNMCRIFSTFDNYISHMGVYSGFEKNNYLASRGIVLKNYNEDTGTFDSTIKLSKWTKTWITPSKRRFRLDITESLMNMINNNINYSDSWSNLVSLGYGNYKSKYTMNTMMRFITITNDTAFNLYVDQSSKSFGFSNNPDRKTKLTKVENIKSRLYVENNRYYMDVEDLDNKQYYAEMIINL